MMQAGLQAAPALLLSQPGPSGRIAGSPGQSESPTEHYDEGRRARESLPMSARAVGARGATTYRCLSGKVLHKARDPGRCRARYTHCNMVAAADPPVMKDPSHSDDRR